MISELFSKCFETFRKFKDAINMPGMPHVPTLLVVDAKVCRVSPANEPSLVTDSGSMLLKQDAAYKKESKDYLFSLTYFFLSPS